MCHDGGGRNLKGDRKVDNGKKAEVETSWEEGRNWLQGKRTVAVRNK